MAEIFNNNYAKCEIDSTTKIPIMDEKYYNSRSAYDRCKCLDKLKTSLEILVKTEPAKYKAYLDIYTKKYNDNNCQEVFKNYIQTNAQEIYNKVTKEDKERIEAQSIKERKQRIYIGLVVFAVVLGVVGIYSTRKS